MPQLSLDAETKQRLGASTFEVGEIVEYFSASQGTWIPAKVLALNSQGTFNLDCKPDVPPEKIRKRSTEGAGVLEHQVGEIVEYLSASQGGWIPAKVLAVNSAQGTYDLDCKPGVTPEKIRRPAAAPNSIPSTIQAGSARSTSLNLTPPPGTPAKELTAPVQLLRVHRTGGPGAGWRYELCPEGAAALQQHGSRRIAVVAVCGLYRTGKSFLLNALLERGKKGLPPFKVGGTTQACTEGLWLWGSVDSDNDQSPLLAFIDCEGFGSTSSDRTRDAQLLTLCGLLSSVLVLNTKGALNEGQFNALALTCKFAEHIEERGNEASRPALLWVLRDFALELRDPAGCPITPDEYLEQCLHAAPTVAGLNSSSSLASSLPSKTAERGQAAKDVRRSLLGFFSHRSCMTLVQPAIEESELQRLDQVPYASLRSEFRAGVEALRTQLVQMCNSTPKTVGGQLLGCAAFVGLLGRLVESLNSSRALSVKGAWETVQHGACRDLAEELRAQASSSLRSLAAGQALPGGARLPLGEEALRGVLRDQRHQLKNRWDERAIGEERVRREYWQELKEALAREEQSVRQSNARFADQQLVEALKRWQEWLDDDKSGAAAGEGLADELGKLMERMPSTALSRAGRTAVEAAARRVVAARAAVASTKEWSAEAQRRAVAWGEQAAQQEGAARTELETAGHEVQRAMEGLRSAQTQERTARMELQGRLAELHDGRQQLAAALRDVEEAKAREMELRSQQRAAGEREAALRAELDDARAAAGRAEAERLASERGASEASGRANAELQRLEAEVRAAKEDAARAADQLASERAVLKGESERTRNDAEHMVEDVRRQLDAERNSMKGEQERARKEQAVAVEEARKQLEEERTRNADAIAAEQNRLLEQERNAGVLEGQVLTLSNEKTTLHDRINELQICLREAEVKAGRQRQESERLSAEHERVTKAAEQAREEVEQKLKQQREEFEARLDEELSKKKQSKMGCVKLKPKKLDPSKA